MTCGWHRLSIDRCHGREGLMGQLRECFFVGVAAHLPRLNVSDRLRPAMLRLAGARVGRDVRIWDGLSVRPIGAAERLTIG